MTNPRPIPRVEAIDDATAALLRQLSPAESIVLVGDANITARALVAAGARRLHPNWTEAQIRAEVAGRMLGDAT
jgi:hypothetical protein